MRWVAVRHFATAPWLVEFAEALEHKPPMNDKLYLDDDAGDRHALCRLIWLPESPTPLQKAWLGVGIFASSLGCVFARCSLCLPAAQSYIYIYI